MRDIKVASRYAKSLLGIAIDNKCLEAVFQDMTMINKVCNENHELVLVLKNPIVKGDKKLAILNEIFKGINNVSASFVKLIVAKKRESILFDIANAFIDAYKEHHNIKIAHVTSAVALNADQKENIKKLVNKSYNATIELVEKVDAAIIGGIILRVEDKQVDESIKRKLQNLVMEFN